MDAAETFRLSVAKRLEAAAEEIFLIFRSSVTQYEEEIERQRQLLALSTSKPHVKLHRIGKDTRARTVSPLASGKQ